MVCKIYFFIRVCSCVTKGNESVARLKHLRFCRNAQVAIWLRACSIRRSLNNCMAVKECVCVFS
jgi:hypothetical protein